MSEIKVFDTGPFIVIERNDRTILLGDWPNVNNAIAQKRVISVAAVKAELERGAAEGSSMSKWLNDNDEVFTIPDEEEQKILREILASREGQSLIKEQDRRKNVPVADPFVIAKAVHINRTGSMMLIPDEATVVTTETPKPLGNRYLGIPNVCDKFNVNSIHFRDFSRDEGWKFNQS